MVLTRGMHLAKVKQIKTSVGEIYSKLATYSLECHCTTKCVDLESCLSNHYETINMSDYDKQCLALLESEGWIYSTYEASLFIITSKSQIALDQQDLDSLDIDVDLFATLLPNSN